MSDGTPEPGAGPGDASAPGEPTLDALMQLDAEAIAGLGYESAQGLLELAVECMEAGSLPLDESIRLFERGIQLAERCGDLLSAAELRVTEIGGGEAGGP